MRTEGQVLRDDVEVHPEAFARWGPQQPRIDAEFAIRVGTQPDVAQCVDLARAIGLGDLDAWDETLTRTVSDGVERALFVADIAGELAGYGRVVHAGAPAEPEGWYLLGVTVSPRWRRRGIGEALTLERMRWLADRADCVYYFTHRENRPSQALHQRLGFVEVPGEFLPPGGAREFAATQRLYIAHLHHR